LELLFELVFSALFELVFAAFAAGAEYAFYKTQKRAWMWIVGVIAIGVMIWWRGAAVWTTWALASGWLAALLYFDWRIRQAREGAS
jgi:uncharacterized protein (DUF983 family)